MAGNVTLRLNDVPWDQALDLVLKAKNLGKRQQGNIIEILPLDELNKQTKEELEATKSSRGTRTTENRDHPDKLHQCRRHQKSLGGHDGKDQPGCRAAGSIGGGSSINSTTSLDVSQSILSARGNVTVDTRTNQLIIKDTGKTWKESAS